MARQNQSTANTPNKSNPHPSHSHGESNVMRGPGREEVARRAYELYLARGAGHGRDVEDWLQAERELKLGRY
jgi:hypothetical protein